MSCYPGARFEFQIARAETLNGGSERHSVTRSARAGREKTPEIGLFFTQSQRKVTARVRGYLVSFLPVSFEISLNPNMPMGGQPASGIDEGTSIIVFVLDC